MAADRNLRLAWDIEPAVVGPMPVKRFIRRYLNLLDAPPPHLKSISFDSVLDKPHKEEDIYIPLVSLDLIPTHSWLVNQFRP